MSVRRFLAVALVSRGRFTGYLTGGGTSRDPWSAAPDPSDARPFATEGEARVAAASLRYPDTDAWPVEVVIV